jgi:hypothetical protein
MLCCGAIGIDALQFQAFQLSQFQQVSIKFLYKGTILRREYLITSSLEILGTFL